LISNTPQLSHIKKNPIANCFTVAPRSWSGMRSLLTKVNTMLHLEWKTQGSPGRVVQNTTFNKTECHDKHGIFSS
jgi:hypothetical protein